MNWKASAYRIWRKLYKAGGNLRSMGRHQEYFYRHDLQQIPELRPPKIPVSMRLLNLEELELLHEIWPIDLSKAAARLQAGHSCCYLTSFEDRPIAYQWVQFDGRHFVQQAGQWMPIWKGEEFMIYHTRVKDEYQSNGINAFMLCKILFEFAKQGYQRGYIYTSSKNTANQKGIGRIGFVHCNTIHSLRIGNWFFTFQKIKLN